VSCANNDAAFMCLLVIDVMLFTKENRILLKF